MKLKAAVLAALVAAAFGGAAHAQFGGPPPGGPPMSGGFQMTPQMRDKMQAMRKFRDSHKNVFAVQQTVRALGAMEQDPAMKLNKAQAKSVLAVLTKWRSKPVMTDTQARVVNKQLTDALTIPQLKQLAAMHGPRRGPGGSGFRPGGGAGGRGGFNPANIPTPHEFNPLNPDTSPMERMRARMKQNLDTLVQGLKATR